ncbi:helix-turn-helix domain-containing protein [Streptomyces sp. GbtcB7]|uniref:AraC-like ligand-binding domain-containing protein n=1 Tax=Streptomyces sp. GbtcB7 TaxID=2824752 RepID=UPI001C30C716|nr:helix-turn-helix domain-containing protein [Streptomyces sp. GbtcB7]
MSIVIDTAGWPVDERGSRWQEALSSAHAPLSFHPRTREILGRMRHGRLGALRYSEAVMPEGELRRSAAVVRRGPLPPEVLVLLQLEGSATVLQACRQSRLEPGDLTLCEPTRPCSVDFSDGARTVAMVLPGRMLALPPRRLLDLTALRVDGDSGAGSAAAALVTSLVSRPAAVTWRQEQRLGDAVAAVLTAALEELLPTAPAASGPRPDLVARIHQYVEVQLGDPELDPARIAAAHRISVRYLNRLLAGEGTTVVELIRSRRLECCRRDLADPSLRELPISAIAGRWGIPNASRFSHLFRACYGMSPRAFRTTALTPA